MTFGTEAHTIGMNTEWLRQMPYVAPSPQPTPTLIAESFDIDDIPLPIAEADAKPAPVRLVGVGWSKNGRYYSRELLQRKAALWKEGTKMYLEHNDRHIKDLAAVLVRDSYYDDHGRWGPGIYGDARIFPDHKEMLKARQGSAGTSITAMGVFAKGEAEGRKGDIVADLTEGLTCDFVAEPAAGGQYEISESVSMTATEESAQDQIDRLTAENAALAESLATVQAENLTLRTNAARLKAAAIVAEKIGAASLPDAAKSRIQTTVIAGIRLTESHDLDTEALTEAIDTEITEMTTFLEAVTPKTIEPRSPVQGMGATPEARTTMLSAFAESFRRQGMPAEDADRLAAIAVEEI